MGPDTSSMWCPGPGRACTADAVVRALPRNPSNAPHHSSAYSVNSYQVGGTEPPPSYLMCAALALTGALGSTSASGLLQLCVSGSPGRVGWGRVQAGRPRPDRRAARRIPLAVRERGGTMTDRLRTYGPLDLPSWSASPADRNLTPSGKVTMWLLGVKGWAPHACFRRKNQPPDLAPEIRLNR